MISFSVRDILINGTRFAVKANVSPGISVGATFRFMVRVRIIDIVRFQFDITLV